MGQPSIHTLQDDLEKNCPVVTKLQLHSQTSLRQLISDTLYLNKGRGSPSREAFCGRPDSGSAVVIFFTCSHGGKTNTVLPIWSEIRSSWGHCNFLPRLWQSEWFFGKAVKFYYYWKANDNEQHYDYFNTINNFSLVQVKRSVMKSIQSEEHRRASRLTPRALCGSFFKSGDIKVIWLGLPRLILKTGGVIGLACVTWLWMELTWADPAD